MKNVNLQKVYEPNLVYLMWKQPATKDITSNNTNMYTDSKLTSRVREKMKNTSKQETSDLFTEVHLH
jgi:hypothetical protein